MKNNDALQQQLFAELHNRPFPLLGPPVSISHIVMLDPGDHGHEIAHICDLAEKYSVPPPPGLASCYYQNFGEFEFRWERHTEFSSYIVIVPNAGATPFCETAISLLPGEWLDNIPGTHFGGDHIELRPAQGLTPTAQSLHPFFEGQKLIGSKVLEGSATLWTALRNHSDGYSRILVYTDRLDICDCGRLVRSLIELSAYRNLTLLALPIARDLIPVVSKLEYLLADLTERLTEIGSFADEKQLLEELSACAAQLEKLISENNFRFAATEAYYSLTEDRLLELAEESLPNLRTLSQFYHRRFRPGFSTCQSIRSRMDNLSVRVNRSAGLLRTRVDLALEAQNQSLLRSMDRRAMLQLRMQQTVEGLSIIAMTHYSLSLLGHLLAGIPSHVLPLEADTLVAMVTPVVFLGAWLSIRSIRKKFQQADETAAETP
ncbi:MAG: DUF3422 domain-containing protein [Pseudomonadales bacterium]